MDWTIWLAFNLALLGALVSPGPAFFATMRAALGSGRRSGILCALGLALGAGFWSLLALLGLTALFKLVPVAFVVLKILGAAYLLWFAVSLWRNAARPVEAGATLRLTGFRLGLVSQLANPKAVVFIAAIFSTVLPADLPVWLWPALLANLVTLEASWYSCVALVLTTAPMRAAYLGARLLIDRIAAACLGLLALRIAS